MCTISDTVEMTMSIITEIGSSRMPMSMCRLVVKGSHSKFHGISLANVPSAERPPLKYR